jgi:ribonuclease HI
MTYLASVAHSDTLVRYPLASFGLQPAPDCPGGGFTIDVIGVCHLYPGPGGWAAIFASGAEISGGGSNTTSDQMHILAATRALDATPVGTIVDIQTSSNLLVQVLRSAGARRGNADLWRALDQACALRRVTFSQIKEGEIAARALAEAEYNHQADRRAIAWLPLLPGRQVFGTNTGAAP